MTKCDIHFFLLNTGTISDFQKNCGKFISRKNLNICLLFIKKIKHNGKFRVKYVYINMRY